MTYDDDIQEYSRPCTNCEYHRQRAQRWRDEAYKQAGHPLPEREQEPVAFASHGVVNWIADKQFQHEALLYSAPQRKPLSWERVLEIGLECANDHSRLPFEVKVARAIEAAHGITGEKNGTR